MINVLRKRSLPGVDFSRPAEVLKALNEAYLMRDHANLYFTMWYGVFDVSTGSLAYASGGHPPALLLGLKDGEARKLMTPNLSVGMIPDAAFTDDEVEITRPSNLYIYSDGAYEVETTAGEEWRVDEFLGMVAESPKTGVPELDRIEQGVREVMRLPDFDDDFSLLIVNFS